MLTKAKKKTRSARQTFLGTVRPFKPTHLPTGWALLTWEQPLGTGDDGGAAMLLDIHGRGVGGPGVDKDIHATQCERTTKYGEKVDPFWGKLYQFNSLKHSIPYRRVWVEGVGLIVDSTKNLILFYNLHQKIYNLQHIGNIWLKSIIICLKDKNAVCKSTRFKLEQNIMWQFFPAEYTIYGYRLWYFFWLACKLQSPDIAILISMVVVMIFFFTKLLLLLFWNKLSRYLKHKDFCLLITGIISLDLSNEIFICSCTLAAGQLNFLCLMWLVEYSDFNSWLPIRLFSWSFYGS